MVVVHMLTALLSGLGAVVLGWSLGWPPSALLATYVVASHLGVGLSICAMVRTGSTRRRCEQTRPRRGKADAAGQRLSGHGSSALEHASVLSMAAEGSFQKGSGGAD